MVLRETRKRQTLVLFLVFACYGLLAGGVFLLKPAGEDTGDDTDEAWVQNEEGAEGSSETELSLPDAIDFQPVVDAWAGTVGGNKSVVIYDLDREEVFRAVVD